MRAVGMPTSKHATNRAQRAQATISILSKQITGLLIVVAQAPLLPDHWSWLKTPNRQRANTPNTKHRAQRAGAYAHAQMRNVHTDMTHGRGSGNEHKQAHTSHTSTLFNANDQAGDSPVLWLVRLLLHAGIPRYCEESRRPNTLILHILLSPLPLRSVLLRHYTSSALICTTKRNRIIHTIRNRKRCTVQ